ncbi:MAG: helix-turn-helix domain-containing protein [Ruminococcaceae bacterium]|nr:helix-turn-helix domain-containing protein [Oscillospiraceae bacterium]
MKQQQDRLQIEKHIVVDEHSVKSEYPVHWHNYFEIEIILSGKGIHVINDVEYPLGEYNVFFLTTTDFHYYKVDEETHLLNISFDEDAVDEKEIGFVFFSQTERAYCLEYEEYERIVKATELLAHECTIEGDCQRALMQYILKCILRKSTYPSGGSATETHYRGIKRAIAYMETHFREPITLNSLAAEAGYHPTYFSELFKKVTGETYINTLNKLRVGYARTLLANGFSVSDACFMSGFGSLSNFLTIFKKNCQMSPAEYRTRSMETGK